MMNSQSPRPALLIHIPKTAGTSLWAALKSTGQSCQDLHDDPSRFRRQVTLTTFGHHSLPSLLALGVLDGTYLDDRFKFAFVRNPWDRMVSLFHYLEEQWQGRLTNPGGFTQFIRRVAGGEIPPIGPFNVRGLSQANPQLHWLRRPAANSARQQDDRLLPDFIGRYEHLQHDWRIVCQRIGIRAELPHLNRSQRKHYREYYDADLEQQVARHFAEEIEAFRYTF